MNIIRNFVCVCAVGMLCFMPAALVAESNDEEYIVKKHDTLWDISSQKLKDPFLWKRLWNENRDQIKNPDLIFPGQKLSIPEGSAGEATSSAHSAQQAVKEQMPAGRSALQAKKAPRRISAEKMTAKEIAAYEGGPVVSRDILIFSGAIVDKVPSVGKISASPSGKIIMGQEDSVYIMTDVPAVRGAMFYVFDGPEKIVHPVTDRFIGYLVRIKGTVEVTGEEGGNEKALIVKSLKDINVNDLLGEYYPVAQARLHGQKPTGINGVIVTLTDEKIIAGGGNIVYLDKGAEDGVAAGDLFEVTSGDKPNIPVGVIQVIHAQERTATALIRTAQDAIRPGDSFGN